MINAIQGVFQWKKSKNRNRSGIDGIIYILREKLGTGFLIEGPKMSDDL